MEADAGLLNFQLRRPLVPGLAGIQDLEHTAVGCQDEVAVSAGSGNFPGSERWADYSFENWGYILDSAFDH